MTLALTREGRVLQMGATGATSAEGCSWEGCLLPTQVRRHTAPRTARGQ